MKKRITGSLGLLLTACIWGFAFVAQTVGCGNIGCFTFMTARSYIGGLILIPVILFLKNTGIIHGKILNRKSIIAGVACGICLFVASSFQQLGLMRSTVSESSFITALYVLIVPILGIFVGKKVSIKLWIAVAIALVGMWLLCMSDSFSLSLGNILLLCGSLSFAVHIIVIDHFSPTANGVVIACIQFFTCAVLATVAMLITENTPMVEVMSNWMPILYAGLLSSGVAYTLQIVCQKNVDPTPASIIMSMESVFGAIGGWLLLGQTLDIRQIVGCVLMFGAIVFAQL